MLMSSDQEGRASVPGRQDRNHDNCKSVHSSNSPAQQRGWSVTEDIRRAARETQWLDLADEFQDQLDNHRLGLITQKLLRRVARAAARRRSPYAEYSSVSALAVLF